MKSVKNIVPVLIAAAFLAGCSASSDKKAQLEELKAEQAKLTDKITKLQDEIAKEHPEQVVVKAKDVAVAELAPRKFDQFVQTQGKIDSRSNILVSAKSAGVISQILVHEGDNVAQGQTLAQIDNSLMVRNIDEVKASLTLANTVYERQKNLWDQKIGTEVQYLQAKNSKEGLDRRLATLQQQLDMLNIKSPISGTVDQVPIKLGENIAPGMPAVRVVNASDLKVNVNISEAYADKVQKGDRAVITIGDDKELTANVTFVGRTIDALSRTFTIEIQLPPNSDLRPNMTCIVKVIFHTDPSAIVVPVNVVQEINNEKVVYVAESDGKTTVARKKVVNVTGVYDNLAEIKSGLKAGDKIITVGYQGLNDGEVVKI
jgi:RND family efflux transporter MFP subunit